ncbi:Gfo/Idh/MocA family protein [Paenibacillus koleovorans]|uniref:Gfo/Idh/MocA family protein n=1 Tax=Paenibacillus koleovorans TaxID=121608 RepID=UPI001C3F4EB2|nr:Gfo/Idh/MocA family oxidoreductase [Paenibacillus koleovorans]
MTRTFRVAMIGAGSRAKGAFFPAIASMDDVEMVAMCDIDKERLNLSADQYGIEGRYGDTVLDYRRMIEEVKPDAVFAIGHPHLMYDIWRWCLNRGLHLFIEKPMALTIHQARALTYVAKQKGCITQVGYQRRIAPMAVKLREECLKRGPITHAVCRFYKNQLKPSLGVQNHMTDDIAHSIDTLRWICGGEVVKVESEVKSIQTSTYSFISGTLHFDNGSTGYFINSWCSGRRIFDIEIHAPGICAEAEYDNKGYLYADGDTRGIEFDAKEISDSRVNYVFTGVHAKIREFVDCCRENRQPGSSFEDALKTMEVIEIIQAQALFAGK